MEELKRFRAEWWTSGQFKTTGSFDAPSEEAVAKAIVDARGQVISIEEVE